MSAYAQSVTAATDTTGTVVTAVETAEGMQFTIDQGSLSADRTNLFHSFEAFSLESGETANFLAQPSVQNILARVNGGMPSILNGLLQVTGEGANAPNLFLMNPAGVLFGAEAALNLPANLTVTSADGIGFGQNWFSAVGDNAYSALNDRPSGDFAFLRDRPGSVLNAGSLSVADEAAITLLGGTVINTGTLSAPGGAVTIAAIPGDNIVRLSQENSLLSLELTTLDQTHLSSAGHPAVPAFTALDLPTLLTHSETTHATDLSVAADGSVRLTSANSLLPTDIGDVVTSGAVAVDSENGQGGQIAVLGNRIGILNAQLYASGTLGGGTIRLGGDYQGGRTLPTAERILVSAESSIFADAIASGDGGRVIVWSDGATRYAGHISAVGGQTSGNGGFVEVSGKVNLDFQGSVDANAPQGRNGSLLLDPEEIVIEAGNNSLQDPEINDGEIFLDDNDGGFIYRISAGALESLSGDLDIILEARDSITLENLLDNKLTFQPGTGTISFEITGDGPTSSAIFSTVDTNDSLITNGRDIDISGIDLVLGNILTAPVGGSVITGGSIFLTGSDTAGTRGSVQTGNLVTAGNVLEQKGDVVITSGVILTQNIRTGSPINFNIGGSGGDVILTNDRPAGQITTGDIEVRDYFGGTVSFAATGSITTGIINQGDLSDSISDNFFDDDFFDDDFFDDGLFGEDGFFEDGDFFSAADDLLSIEDDGDGSVEGDRRDRVDEALEDFEDLSESLGDFDYEFEFLELNGEFVDTVLSAADGANSSDYSAYLGIDLETQALSLESIQEMLTTVAAQSGNRSAIVYINPPAASTENKQTNQQSGQQSGQISDERLQPDSDALEIIVVTADGTPFKIVVPGVTRSQLFQSIEAFRGDVVSSARRGSDYYLSGAQQLYQWLIAPIEAELGAAAIDTLVFSMGEGLRSLPIAALHDGEQFLIEKYSLAMVPAVSLIDAQYAPMQDAQVLAMGASSFEDLSDLPAVPLELELINRLWPGATFLNESFTRQNLVEQRQQSPYRVIHLATHAEFKAGSADNSYIQLWDEQLKLSELNRFGWQYPAVDLLVLSACSTAVGSPEAEMGFAGLAVASGVRSAMASLWSVSDVGTLALMSEFYDQLQVTPTKAEALRTAQLAMLKGDVHTQNGELVRGAARGGLPLPSALSTWGESDFSHPYYWSGFTMIGSPW